MICVMEIKISISVSAAGKKVLEDHMTVVFLCITQDTDPTEFSIMLFENQRFLKTNGKAKAVCILHISVLVR